jgi:hypothetical protein
MGYIMIAALTGSVYLASIKADCAALHSFHGFEGEMVLNSSRAKL